MGKNSKVSVKRANGKPMSRQGAGKTNFGRLQKGNHSMNPGTLPLLMSFKGFAITGARCATSLSIGRWVRKGNPAAESFALRVRV